MNYSKFLSIILISGLWSCQSNGPKIADEHSSHDSTSHASSSERTEMATVLDNMMKDMHQAEMTGNADLDFAVMMKSHHEGAVEMAEEELKSGKDEAIKQMAREIAGAQKTEIEELDEFISSHKNAAKNYDPAAKNNGFGKVMDKSMKMMMELPELVAGSSVDEQFVALMIPHHQSAVYMAEGLLQYGKDPKLMEMAKKMIADQNREIDAFKKWRSAR